MSFSVLYVCTGNICRSPMGERLMRARLAPEADVEVGSAGTQPVTGYPMDDLAALITREFHADPEDHVARAASAAVTESADLILTATVEHRDVLLRLVPRVMRRAFTMREFVRLGRTLPPLPLTPGGGDLTARVAQVAARRGVTDAPTPGADDIGDPFGASIEVMRQCGDVVSSTVDSTLQILGLAPHA